jgi:hypothetical protein
MPTIARSKHIRALKRRAAHLEERIERYKGQPDRGTSFDAGELAAIRWALAEVLKVYPQLEAVQFAPRAEVGR